MTHIVNVNGISGGASVQNSSSEAMIRQASSELMEGSSNCKALKKGPWTAAEDQILMEYVRTHGEGNWNSVQRNSGLNRCGKSCRLRWANHLRPNLKKGAFTPDEERLILELHAKYGNKWARMASQLPGRTDNEIKNYWNTRVKRRQRQGLPLYPHDIKQSQHQQSHSHSHSHPTALTIPTGLTQQASSTGAAGGLPPAGQTFCFQFQTSSSSQQQQHLPPMPPTPLHHSPLSSPGKSHHSLHFFDPSSLANSSAFAFHRPAPVLGGAPLRYKRYREGSSVVYSPPISPSQRSASILRASSMPDISSNQPFSEGTTSIPEMASFQYQQPRTFHGSLPPLPRSGSSPFDFGNILLSSPTRPVYSVKSEQVLSQAHSQSELSTDSKANATAGEAPHCSNSNGLLDDLLHEAEAMVACGASNPRKAGGSNNINLFEDHQKHVMDGYGRWPATNSSVDSSFLEGKLIVEDNHNNSMPDDLSKLLSFMPSTETVSDWYTCTDSGELSNGGQSSGVTEASLEFDVMQQHMASLFPVNVGSTDHDRVNSNTWDNLSGIC